MHKIGVQSGGIFSLADHEKGFATLAAHGFECVDLNVDNLPPSKTVKEGEVGAVGLEAELVKQLVIQKLIESVGCCIVFVIGFDIFNSRESLFILKIAVQINIAVLVVAAVFI